MLKEILGPELRYYLPNESHSIGYDTLLALITMLVGRGNYLKYRLNMMGKTEQIKNKEE